MHFVIIGIAVLILILLIIRGIYDEKKAKKKLIKKLKESFGSTELRDISYEEFECIRKFHLSRKDLRQDGQVIDDITWNDLDMDKVFLMLDKACSQTGSEYLYDALRRPVKDNDEAAERDRVISHFENDAEKRLAFQLAFSNMGKTGKVSVADQLIMLENVPEDRNIRHYLCILLAALSISCIFIYPQFGFMVFFITLVFNVTTYFRRKSEIEPFIVSFAYIIRMMYSARTLLKLKDEEVKTYLDRLSGLLFSLRKLSTNTFILFAGRGATGGIIDLVMDYLRIFLHLDLIKFNKMLNIVQSNRDGVFELFDIMGFLDASIAVASFRHGLPYYCVPEHERKSGLDIEGLSHPLLTEPVPSDIKTERGVLVTGSNASGKSTFLKSVALSALLSQTIVTVYAKKYDAPFFEIYSSMSLSDDIMEGESYYMAEIKSLKRIIDKTSDNEIPVICFIDEVLRGTNTVERIAASSQILKSLSKDGVLPFAATHDIELTWMLTDYYDNYHFSEEVLENDISFSYTLKPGRAQSRNAIMLLSLMGYDEKITDAAKSTAENFARDNKWEKL